MPGLLRNRSGSTATAHNGLNGNDQLYKLDNLSLSPSLSLGHTQGTQDHHGEQQRQDDPDEPGPPPNGGTRAWLQVLGAFFLNFNTWGLINSFGMFQSYYSLNTLAGTSAFNIAWIGSIQGFLMLFVGVLCGRAIDAGWLHADLAIGIFLQIFGMMMVSICTKYWQFFLAQGIVVGVGCGCCFFPSVTVVGTYFSSRRSLALGIATTGSSVGGVIYPIVLRRLFAEVGFGWAVRVMAFIMLVTLLVSASLMRTRLPPRTSGPVIDLTALKDPAYVVYLLGVFFTFMGLYIPFFYVEGYSLSINIPQDMSFYMLIIMNAASTPGRVLPLYLADRVGNLSILVPSTFFSGIILVVWFKVRAQPGMIAISVLFGFISGAILAVVPATVAFLCPDLSKLGSRLGMTLFVAGFGLLIGSPIAGVILERQSAAAGGRQIFWGLLVFAGVVVLVGCLGHTVTRVLKVGFTVRKA